MKEQINTYIVTKETEELQKTIAQELKTETQEKTIAELLEKYEEEL